jgi:hypothetical protein
MDFMIMTLVKEIFPIPFERLSSIPNLDQDIQPQLLRSFWNFCLLKDIFE